MDTIVRRFRTRLMPALVTAFGIALLMNGLLAYTTAVEPEPQARPLASYLPLPTLEVVTLPGGNGQVAPSFPADRVATRVVVPRLNIDLPVILPPADAGTYPLCDVAMYLPNFSQPGEGSATYIYAHAREGMFLPLLIASQDNNGQRMIGYLVQVYTSDDYVFTYKISQVLRHVQNYAAATGAQTERLFLQTSEGPNASYPKLLVAADPQSVDRADPQAAHPDAQPRQCRGS